MEFFDWKKKVEIIVYNLTNFYLDDLPDEDFYMNYESGTTFKQMAEYIITINTLI